MTRANSRAVRFTESDCDIDAFSAIVGQRTALTDFPHAAAVKDNVLLYEGSDLRATTGSAVGREAVQAELIRALTDGPGIVVLRAAFANIEDVDRVTAAFNAIIATERAAGNNKNDHFAKAGANDRVWNALEKLAIADPDAFVDYYANDLLDLVSTAWLGPGYQTTSQVNVVRPGGHSQDPHRDYHLGFLSNDVAARYPAHVHLLSPVLTLQGAVAHSDMPVSSGPTMYLPFSHRYPPGYLAWRLPAFRQFFDQHHVQLPLHKGDAAFFNPAVFHGAGSNFSTDVQRMANLLEVSSAFGRAMETVDRVRVASAVYPVLLARQAAGVDPAALANAVACATDGYPFPTNLDLDSNVTGLTPLSQRDLVTHALTSRVTPDRLADELLGYVNRHRSSMA